MVLKLVLALLELDAMERGVRIIPPLPVPPSGLKSVFDALE
jgi:hypothetical protein